MIIKDREYTTCPTCGLRKLVIDEVYGCDWCKREINLPQNEEYLRMTVFYTPSLDETENLQFCSWLCCFRKLREIQCEYFVDLPCLNFDQQPEGLRIEDFWAAIREIANGF